MKMLSIVLLIISVQATCFAQSKADVMAVEKACMNYIEGFYEGDTNKLKKALRPKMYKFGFMKNKNSGEYAQVDQLTFEAALNYAKSVSENKRFPKKDAPRIVEVLDISDHIAAAKVVAWWGTDYMLLSRSEDGWMIEQVLWEGPLNKNHLKK